jgi:hypothetical protein
VSPALKRPCRLLLVSQQMLEEQQAFLLLTLELEVLALVLDVHLSPP